MLISSEASSGSGDSTGASTSTSTSASGTSSTSGSTTGLADDTGSTGRDTTGVIFLPQPDMGMFECNVYVQDCPAGQKCIPWADNGGTSWNAWRCSPIADDPASAGQPCHVEGSETSGIDDCALGTMCWAVDPETLEGLCTPLCSGSGEHPACDDPSQVCHIPGDAVLLLCKTICDPLADECPPGQGCLPIWEHWLCDPGGGMGAYGDPCEYDTACAAGLACVVAPALPPESACEGASGCCTELCDVTDPAADLQCAALAAGLTCQALYEDGAAVPGYEYLGACIVP